jgi:hypothetical protein
VDETVAIGARHLGIHLRHHTMGVFRGGQGAIHAHAKAAIAMRIGRRYLDEGDINRHVAAFEKGFHLAQKDGRVIGAAIIDRLADIASHEQCVVAEMRRHFRRAVR